MKMFFSSSLLLALLSAASAERDTTYYTGGIENPNLEDNMFYSSGANVLDDLDQFDALYITYHNCAWEVPSGDEEGGDGGGDGDDWYLASVPSFRANAAFSLYGKLKTGGHSGCNKHTYINSFHTTQGIESFTNAMAAAGLTNIFTYNDGEEDADDWHNGAVTSTCFGDEDRKLNDGGNYYNGAKFSGSSSYGLGCTADKSRDFAMMAYEGGYCDANAIIGVEDDMEELNEQLDLAKCVPVYESGDYFSADDDENTSPLSVLQTSRTCRYHDGTGSCPDPYKKLRQWEMELLRATGAIKNVKWVNQYRMAVLSYTMIAVGGLCCLAAIALASMDCGPLSGDRKSRGRKSRRKRSKSRKSKKERKSKSKRSSRKDDDLDDLAAKSASYEDDVTDASEADTDGEDHTKPSISVSDAPAGAAAGTAVAAGAAVAASDGPPSREGSVASQSVQAVNDMVHFFKTKADQVFQDDECTDEGVETDDESLPHNWRNKGNDETEVGSDGEGEAQLAQETASKKKYRKKRWFSKLMKNSTTNTTAGANGRFY